MGQPPIADFQEDREARLRHGRSGRRAYFVALPVIAAVVAVALLGMIGSRIAPGGKIRPSVSAELAVGSISPSPAHTLQWDNAAPSRIDIPGLTSLPSNASQVVPFDMPPDTLPFDSDSGNFLYGADQGLFVMTAKQTPFQVGTARPCGEIRQAAISGGRVIYSEMVPAGYRGDGNAGCPTFGLTVDWFVSIADFSGVAHQVANGNVAVTNENMAATPGAVPAEYVPSVAITDTTYGFSRPDKSGTSAVVEVHLLGDDSPIFHSDPFQIPVQLLLGDGRLVVVATGPVVDDAAAPQSVWSTTNWQPFGTVGHATGAVALSRDGRRLAFTSCSKVGCPSVETIAPDLHWGMALPVAATFVSVDSGPNSELEATAWISSTPDGTAYIGVSSALGDNNIALVGLDQPTWICVQDDTLLWLSLGQEGSVRLNRMDLRSMPHAT